MEQRSRLWRWVAAVVASWAVLAGCAGGGGPTAEPTLVASWSQADSGTRDWVEAVMPVGPVIVADDAALEDWIARWPTEADGSMDALRAVDLQTSFLVIGGYSRCTEHSTVTVSDGDVWFEISTEDEHVDCAWSPYAIDAWVVALELTGGTAPESVAPGA